MDSRVEIGGEGYLILRSSDVIEAEGKTGKKYWQAHIVMRGVPGSYFTCTSSWKQTKTGTSKIVWSEPYYAEPTNVGRANERGNKEQAEFEYESMIKKAMDKRQGKFAAPMLAEKVRDHRDKLVFPCAVQPKYDGKRILHDGENTWSRGNKVQKPEPVAHIFPFDTGGLITDGELLLPDHQPVNVVMSAAHKYHQGLSDKLFYVIYDVVDYDLPFRDRYELARTVAEAPFSYHVELAQMVIVDSFDEGMTWHEKWTEEGYEGTIWRNLDGKYISHRTTDLQKHKDWIDEEFRIVDIIPAGGGSSAGVGKFLCVTKVGVEFESTATGTLKQRREYLANKQKYVGKWAKVKYRQLTPYGAPFHSNVLEVRETETGGY